jgi:2-isopropylmalate synthase
LNARFKLSDRTWPDTDIEAPPRWVSVDLRDGNQSLENPMTVDQKLEHFQILVDMGFKEIEVGFPSSSEEDFNFVRRLIEENLIPDDVTIQVLVPSKTDLIQRTREALD